MRMVLAEMVYKKAGYNNATNEGLEAKNNHFIVVQNQVNTSRALFKSMS